MFEPLTTTQVDLADPIVTCLAFFFTFLIRKYLPKFWKKAQGFIPMVVMGIALFLRIFIELLMGVSIDVNSFFHALASASLAVAGHSQYRSYVKSRLPSVEEGGEDVEK